MRCATPFADPLAVTCAGTGPTVVWIHGYTMDSRIWQYIWPRLPGFRHVGVDLPGHGRSWPMTPETTLADMATAVAVVLEAEDATRMVALSMGTMVAFEIAIRALHPLSRFAVIAPALVGMPAADGTAERYRLLTTLRRAGISGPRLTDLWMSSPPAIFAGLRSNPAAFAEVRRVVADHSWAELAFGGPAAFYRHPQQVTDLPGSVADMLVVAGDEDMPEFQELGRTLARTVAGAQLVTLPGLGHLPLLECPDRAIPVLREFLG